MRKQKLENPWHLVDRDNHRNNVSTVEMPQIPGFNLGYQYETCVFYRGGRSDVVARYETQLAALAGHKAAVTKYLRC